MTLSRILLATLALGLTALPATAFHHPYHAERQRGETLTVEHTPVARRAVRSVRVVRVRRAKQVRVTLADGGEAVASTRVVRRKRATARRAAYRYSGIAGGCRDAGIVRGRDSHGRPTLLQREVCSGIAPTTRPVTVYQVSE